MTTRSFTIFKKYDESSFSTPVLKYLPSKVFHHECDTAAASISLADKSGGTVLNTLQSQNICHSVLE